MARLFRIVVPVSDIERATKFYESAFAARGERISPGRHYIGLGDVILACVDSEREGDRKRTRPLPDHIYIAVDDIDAAWERTKAAGAVYEGLTEPGAGPLGEIAARPWGERSVYFQDPFGNPLCLVDAVTVFTGRRS